MLRVVVKNPWFMVGVIVALLVLGWVGLEIWFGLTRPADSSSGDIPERWPMARSRREVR